MPVNDNVYVNALAGNSWLDVGKDLHITYCMSSQYGMGWTDEQRESFAAALESYAAVCGLTFEEVADERDADMVEYRVTSAQFKAAFPSSPYGAYQTNWAGYHYGPSDTSTYGYYDANQVGNWLIMHELLHGLGLEHPHHTMHGTGLFPGVSNGVGNDLGDGGFNNTLNTLMSYNILSGYSAGGYDGPMAMDIAALQLMYGANLATGAGDDEYIVARANYKSIWDAGGIDWLVAGTDNGATLDLRPATLDVFDGGPGGRLSQAVDFTGGFTIAYGVDIENARGGAGNDILVGNGLQNILDGGDGNDTYYTDDSNDVIIDSAGIDVLVSNVDASLVGREFLENLALDGAANYGTGNDGDNVIWGSDNSNWNELYGLSGDDWIFGRAGWDYIFGGDGDDVIVGGAGRDFISGGSGSDVFDYYRVSESSRKARDVITDFERGSDLIDLSSIDASTKSKGNNKFKWIGDSNFKKGKAGQLHYVEKSNGKVFVEGDINGDRKADFVIELHGIDYLSKYDFIL